MPEPVSSELVPIPRKDEAFRDLERMIVTGELEPGRWVSETDLIEVSGHTRAPVRSAIQRLADAGLLRIVARRGAQICPISHTEQFRALELRRVVERLIAEAAADRATPAQRRALADVAQGFEAACSTNDTVAMIELDARCFSILTEAADNPFATRALTSVKGLSRRFWVLNQERYGDTCRMAQAHAGVANAVSQADRSQAAKGVDILLDYVEEFTLAVIGFRAPKKS